VATTLGVGEFDGIISSCSSANAFANQKFKIFTFPFGVALILADFRFRWIALLSFITSKASVIWSTSFRGVIRENPK
jgi:hypothetical protein